MPRLKLEEAGFDTMTGLLHEIEFTDGWSAPLANATIDRLSLSVRASIYSDDGQTFIREAGPAAWMTGDRGPAPMPVPPSVDEGEPEDGGE